MSIDYSNRRYHRDPLLVHCWTYPSLETWLRPTMPRCYIKMYARYMFSLPFYENKILSIIPICNKIVRS